MSNKLLQPSSGPGRPKDPAKRQAILEAAKCLFIRSGYDSTSMDSIAAEAGVSKLTVYSHFTDKETLFVCAVESKCEEQLPSLYFELRPEVPVSTTLLAIARGFNTLINSDDSIAMHRLIVAQALSSPRLAELFFEAGPQRMLDAMQQLLENADRSGQLRIENPKHAAEHFFSLIKGGDHFRLLLGCISRPGHEVTEQHIQEVVTLFVRGYRP